MKLSRLIGFACSAAATALLAGCASPSPHPSHTHRAFPAGIAQARKTPGFLLGGQGTDLGTALACRKTGSCLLFGQTLNSFSPNADMLAVYTAPDGTIRWSRRYGGKHAETLTTATLAQHGGALLAGTTQSDLLNDAPDKEAPMPARPLLVRIGKSGKPLWGAVMEDGMGRVLDARRTPDGGYVLAGYTQRNHGKKTHVDAAVVKLNGDGQLQWAHRYDLGAKDTANAIAVGSNGDLMVVGASVGHGHEPHAFSMLLDGSGQVRNAVRYSGKHNLYFVQAVDGDFLVAGQNKPQRGPLLAARVAPNGKPHWAYVYGAPAPVIPLAMATTAQGGFLITGRTQVRYRREAGVAALFSSKGKPVTDLYVGGKGIVEFLGAAVRAPGHYLLWGDTTLFGAKKIDMMGVQWSPTTGIASDFKCKRLNLDPDSLRVKAKPLKLNYHLLGGNSIPSSPIQLHH